MLCKKCGLDAEPIANPRPDTVHEAELRCRHCEGFLGWQKKERNNGRRGPTKYKAEDLGVAYCQMCRLERPALGDNETLDVHHLDGDPNNNARENLFVICTSCHKLVHHQITYRNHFIKKQYRLYESLKQELSQCFLTPDEYERVVGVFAELYGV